MNLLYGVARAGFCVAALSIGTGAGAWSNHALCTWQALAVMPEITRLPAVPAEELDTFLAGESAGLAHLLADEELWARQHVPNYPARPDALAFAARPDAGANLRQGFTDATRINPGARLGLFVQLPPGAALGERVRLEEAAVTTLLRSETTKYTTFAALRTGDLVAVTDVIATASDEPDYGMDIGVWSDNGTAYGARYGLGRQPFGNPAVEFGSQAPLHMGFYHESAITYRAAPFLGRTLAEYRIHLWKSLAVYALRTGHPYWGFRFTGWALHYTQDLTQPYHARVLPGVSLARMLWINSMDLAGFHTGKREAIILVSNRHLALENYQLHRLRADYLRGDFADAPILALRDRTRNVIRDYSDDAPREIISRQAYDEADSLDALLAASLPAKFTSDPDYVMGESESGVDLYALLATSPAATQDAMTRALVPLMGNFGEHTRTLVRAILAARASA